jgi:hypothetical protein
MHEIYTVCAADSPYCLGVLPATFFRRAGINLIHSSAEFYLPSRVVDHVGWPHKLLTLVILLALQLTLGQGVQQLCRMYRYSSISSFFSTYPHQIDINTAATHNMQSSTTKLSMACPYGWRS